jgi:tetratricopeptide (TPR) repeat protein
MGRRPTAEQHHPGGMSNNNAAEAQSAPHRPAQAMASYNLAVRLLGRYRETGKVEDLNRAIEDGRNAVDRTPPDDPERADRLTITGNVLSERFNRLGCRTDLDEAIVVFAQVADMPPGHADRGGHLCNLATALRRRDEAGDLNQAIILGREAVRLTPADHRHRPNVLTNLANSLHERFDRDGDLVRQSPVGV